MPPVPDVQHCPFCRVRPNQAVATLPYVRPKGFGARFGTRTLLGCAPCVRKRLLLETTRSALDGWGSPAAALANPVLLIYGLARIAAVTRDPDRVRRILRTAGVPETALPPDPVRLGYSLAAAIIAADGRIGREEIATASAIGKRLFPDFDETEFARVVGAWRTLPQATDLAAILADAATPQARSAIYRYLVAIAAADDEIAPQERALLEAVAENFGIADPGSAIDAKA